MPIVQKTMLVILLAGLASRGQAQGQDIERDCVVKIHVTQRPPDYYRPWAKASQRKTAGSGVLVAGRRILTNAHVVEYASQIFVQPHQSTEKIPASVFAVAPEMDIAVLQLEDESWFEGHEPLPLADGLPSVKQTVNVYGYPIGGDDMSITEGIVSRIDYANYYHNTGGLRIQVDAALNPGNSGGPAVIDGQIVGLVFSKIIQAENIGYLIPAEELARFLTDIEDGTYDGKPTLFDDLQATENEALRAKLGLDKEMGGVMVREPYLDDKSYPLRPWDVITQIGEHPLDNQGNVRIDDELRMNFKYLIPKLAHDGTVALTRFRAGETLEVEVPVHREINLVIPSLRGTYPRHFIYGPLAFTAATQEFLAGLGGRGRAYLAAVRSPLITRQFDRPAFEGEELVVMANRMFPHRIVKGYSNLPFGVVTHVDDQPIRNLRHLVTTLRDATGEFITLDMAGAHETLVFQRTQLDAATEGILEDEGIRYQCSADLRDVWEKDEG